MSKRIGRGGICTDCGLRKIDTSVLGPELCTVCLEYADWEILHMDGEDGSEGGHENCMICHPELDIRKVKKTGHRNTATKGAHHSHAACNHLATPADRATCRATHTWDGSAWVANA